MSHLPRSRSLNQSASAQCEARVEAVSLDLAGHAQRRERPLDLQRRPKGGPAHGGRARRRRPRDRSLHIDPDVIEGLCVRRGARTSGRRARASGRLASLPDVIAAMTQKDLSPEEEPPRSDVGKPEPTAKSFRPRPAMGRPVVSPPPRTVRLTSFTGRGITGGASVSRPGPRDPRFGASRPPRIVRGADRRGFCDCRSGVVRRRAPHLRVSAASSR